MSTLKPELVFRRQLGLDMNGSWRLTWHENGGISPGVPDCSFVMLEPGCETGWLELKASTTDRCRFEIEPAQHSWFHLHHALVPCFFLIAFPGFVYLVDGSKHYELAKATNQAEVYALTHVRIHSPLVKSALPDILYRLTMRGRDANT